MPNSSLSEQNKSSIVALEKEFAVSSIKIDNIGQQLIEIKTNHLVHINDTLTNINNTVIKNNTEMNRLINEKVEGINEKLTTLKIEDAKTSPGNKLFSEIIKYVILAVIGIGMAFISRGI